MNDNRDAINILLMVVALDMERRTGVFGRLFWCSKQYHSKCPKCMFEFLDTPNYRTVIRKRMNQTIVGKTEAIDRNCF